MDAFNILVAIFMALAAFAWFYLAQDIEDLRQQNREDLQKHQDWLFHQLYSMSPGKVLKPEEIVEERKSEPARVIHMSRDPYSEFNGKKDDWD